MQKTLNEILFVGTGGFIGASLRYLISTHSAKVLGNQFPYGTLLVNVMGGILIGFILELALTTDIISPDMKLFLTTGILGGLTTFSTFSYETMTLFTNGSYWVALLNTGLNLVLSFMGVVLGKYVAHFVK